MNYDLTPLTKEAKPRVEEVKVVEIYPQVHRVVVKETTCKLKSD
jgi:hypothetical protein